jgi:hypothetical protein
VYIESLETARDAVLGIYTFGPVDVTIFPEEEEMPPRKPDLGKGTGFVLFGSMAKAFEARGRHPRWNYLPNKDHNHHCFLLWTLSHQQVQSASVRV